MNLILSCVDEEVRRNEAYWIEELSKVDVCRDERLCVFEETMCVL